MAIEKNGSDLKELGLLFGAMQPSSSPELIGLLSTEVCNSPQPVVFVLSDNSNAVQVMGAGGAATAVTKTDGALLRTALEHCNREA